MMGLTWFADTLSAWELDALLPEPPAPTKKARRDTSMLAVPVVHVSTAEEARLTRAVTQPVVVDGGGSSSGTFDMSLVDEWERVCVTEAASGNIGLLPWPLRKSADGRLPADVRPYVEHFYQWSRRVHPQ